MSKDLIIRSSTEEFITFKLQEKGKGIQVRYENETLWMTQKAMAELFDTGIDNINVHLKNIYDSNELDKEATIEENSIVQKEGNRQVKRNVKFYNLDVIISVGYRINSLRATQFRRWATNILKTFTIQGYVLDKERMKNGSFIDNDYFEKLLEEIREIRLSERRFYQKITDIYKECSFDYDKNSETTQEFYKNVQNKLHFAITVMTAPEIIYNRVDSKKNNMGLTTWKNAPDGKILETDVTIAKNYLSQEEITELNNLVSMYLDYAERQVKLGKIISMKEWKEKLEVFLKINEYNILKDNGTIKREIADKLALDEYNKYRVLQDKNYISDFDELVIETKKLNKT